MKINGIFGYMISDIGGHLKDEEFIDSLKKLDDSALERIKEVLSKGGLVYNICRDEKVIGVYVFSPDKDKASQLILSDKYIDEHEFNEHVKLTFDKDVKSRLQNDIVYSSKYSTVDFDGETIKIVMNSKKLTIVLPICSFLLGLCLGILSFSDNIPLAISIGVALGLGSYIVIRKSNSEEDE